MERLQAQPGVLIDVALADLEEAAVIGKGGDSPRDGLAGQRVEDHIHAAPAGALAAPHRRNPATASP